MDYSQLLSREKHAAFKWLGKQDVFSVRDAGPDNSAVPGTNGGRRTFRSHWWSKTLRPPAEHEAILRPIFAAAARPEANLLLAHMDAHSAALARGPKLFRPTAEQFDSMQHVDIRIPISDLQLPFPAMVIAVPQQCYDAIVAAGADKPGHLMVLRQRKTEEDRNAITVINGEWAYFFQDRDGWDSVEDALHIHCIDQSRDPSKEMLAHVAAMTMARAALNLALMLTHYGHSRPQPLDQKSYTKHRQRADLQRFCTGDFMAVDMVQHVVVRALSEPTGDESGQTGREMPPHWRRGHWRNQKVGAGRQVTKLVFVRPCLVRPDRIVGDEADSQYQASMADARATYEQA